MKPVTNFKTVITMLANSLDIDLDRPGAYVRLHQEECGYLILENIGNSRISLTNYVQVGNDWVADPRVVVYVGSDFTEADMQDNDWYPLEVCEFFGGWQLCAEISANGDLIIRDRYLMTEMANVIDDLIVSSLLRQDWQHSGATADDAVITRTRQYAEPHEFVVEEPNDVPF